MFNTDINQLNRQVWLKKTLAALPAGMRLLDVGAGELRNRPHCSHLEYVSQDFCEYKGKSGGRQAKGSNPLSLTPAVLIWSAISRPFQRPMRASMPSSVAR